MNALDTRLQRSRQLRQAPLRPEGVAPPSPAQIAARVARFRSNFLNRLIRLNEVASLIQFGCGDGRLARRLKVGVYIGVDVADILPSLDRQFTLGGARRDFFTARSLPADAEADLALSLDAINRLAGDGAFNAYLRALFGAARRYVVIHGSDRRAAWSDGPTAKPFTTHIARYFPAWRLAAHVPSPFPPAADAGEFFIYTRENHRCVVPVLALI